MGLQQWYMFEKWASEQVKKDDYGKIYKIQGVFFFVKVFTSFLCLYVTAFDRKANLESFIAFNFNYIQALQVVNDIQVFGDVLI